ncbi:MAG: hypothetical protein COV72_01810 [Candidatus Omnitrophica bacterium CG11_big_fil_rev_8_21_14_0_20_42_13]|uniref:Uncharacterized protein n=1 Tax=Candidatus Ghiorseimicrobium undicola TaxID=1974746 RepID=A0A2H0M180_9BACT|nr:MAG: hypothetical protein COV72_01810 [Candidatus Omnitrophica bacterium CG11_big_fil_rev_8_21_14_0_20_42_13]
MTRLLTIILVGCLVLGLGISGCAQKKAASSTEAIEISKSMETVEQKANYLIGQAKAFYNSRNFQEAVDIAQYVLRAVDKDSQEAKSLLEKAKEALVAKTREVADKTTEDMKKKMDMLTK